MEIWLVEPFVSFTVKDLFVSSTVKDLFVSFIVKALFVSFIVKANFVIGTGFGIDSGGSVRLPN